MKINSQFYKYVNFVRSEIRKGDLSLLSLEKKTIEKFGNENYKSSCAVIKALFFGSIDAKVKAREVDMHDFSVIIDEKRSQRSSELSKKAKYSIPKNVHIWELNFVRDRFIETGSILITFAECMIAFEKKFKKSKKYLKRRAKYLIFRTLELLNTDAIIDSKTISISGIEKVIQTKKMMSINTNISDIFNDEETKKKLKEEVDKNVDNVVNEMQVLDNILNGVDKKEYEEVPENEEELLKKTE